MEEFDSGRQMAKIKAAFRGGPFYANPIKAPAMTIKQGYPEASIRVQQSSEKPSGTMFDPWNYRRPSK